MIWETVQFGFWLSVGFLPLGLFLVWFSYFITRWVKIHGLDQIGEDFASSFPPEDKEIDPDLLTIVSAELVENDGMCRVLGEVLSTHEKACVNVEISCDLRQEGHLLDHGTAFLPRIEAQGKSAFVIYVNWEKENEFSTPPDIEVKVRQAFEASDRPV